MKYRWLFLSMMSISILLGGKPACCMDSTESVTVISGVIGGVYGGVDAVLKGDDLFKGVSDGTALGVVVPGMVIGGISGVILGGMIQTITLQGFKEVNCVGWGSAGVVIGEVGSRIIMSNVVGRQLNQAVRLDSQSSVGPSITGALNWIDLGSTAWEGIKLGKYASSTFETDVQMHRYVCRRIRQEKDPGAALLVGFSKEASDYFFSTGHTELRDLQNDWEGTFYGTKSF